MARGDGKSSVLLASDGAGREDNGMGMADCRGGKESDICGKTHDFSEELRLGKRALVGVEEGCEELSRAGCLCLLRLSVSVPFDSQGGKSVALLYLMIPILVLVRSSSSGRSMNQQTGTYLSHLVFYHASWKCPTFASS